MSGFIQQDPQNGQPATEKTDVRLFFDRDRVYVSFRCWEKPAGATRGQRDAPRQHDVFTDFVVSE
jgi:hypothetical protein